MRELVLIIALINSIFVILVVLCKPLLDVFFVVFHIFALCPTSDPNVNTIHRSNRLSFFLS